LPFNAVQLVVLKLLGYEGLIDMEITFPWVVITTGLIWLMIEARNGQQKNFARVVMGILFTNMVFVNTGLYTRAIGDPVVFIALGVLVLMLGIRLFYWLQNRRAA
tara:strand:- start:86860 stop:87174 length:315 start_codon:yes stop_codon:yes gene_type:complete